MVEQLSGCTRNEAMLGRWKVVTFGHWIYINLRVEDGEVRR